MKAELEKYGHYVSKRKIARMMRELNLFVKRRLKFRITTDSNLKYPIASNLLNEDFRVSRKNQVWVSDMTYIHTSKGWLYLTVIIGLFNRKVISWTMSNDLSTETPLFQLDIWLLRIIK